MTRTVFRPHEIILNPTVVFIDSPSTVAEVEPLEQDDESGELEEYQGPTVEELRREAEEFKAHWEAERETMMRSARLEGDRMIKEAEEAAQEELNRRSEEALEIKQQAEAEAQKIIAEARQRAEDMAVAAQITIENQRRKAEEEGEKAGRETGFQQGKVEVERLVKRTQIVLERAQEKRTEILVETEQRIIDLVILIARKVIKVISEGEREVIIANVQDALRKVKGHGDIIIKVHTADLALASERLTEFIQMLESGAHIQVQEDLSIDQGGCIIETDFGEIDARIATQLTELEAKILEIVPVKVAAKAPQSASAAKEKA